jgi:hypothetical protein
MFLSHHPHPHARARTHTRTRTGTADRPGLISEPSTRGCSRESQRSAARQRAAAAEASPEKLQEKFPEAPEKFQEKFPEAPPAIAPARAAAETPSAVVPTQRRESPAPTAAAERAGATCEQAAQAEGACAPGCVCCVCARAR